MYGNLILLVFLSLLISINGQHNDERDLPRVSYQTSRNAKASFDAQFPRGRCPERFYQSGDECLYFSTDGKIYAWKQAERVCSRRVARMLNPQSSSNIDQPNMTPTKGVRQLILNTPEKTEIFRALFREYNEQNFAVRLPSDYNTLERCNDANDDKWPNYCENVQNSNASCFETISNGPVDICLREIECNQRYLRLACEFTLPGSAELTDSKFRHCPKAHGHRRRLPLWTWITIIIVAALILLIIAAVVFVFISKSKKNASQKKKSLPEPRPAEEKVIQVTSKQEDPAAEPMLVRAAPTNVSDTGYLQPRSPAIDNTENA